MIWWDMSLFSSFVGVSKKAGWRRRTKSSSFIHGSSLQFSQVLHCDAFTFFRSRVLRGRGSGP